MRIAIISLLALPAAAFVMVIMASVAHAGIGLPCVAAGLSAKALRPADVDAREADLRVPVAIQPPRAGNPVLADAPGVVIYTGKSFADGTIVDLRHQDGLVTRYAHLARIAAGISPGVRVRTGDLLGRAELSDAPAIGAKDRHARFEFSPNPPDSVPQFDLPRGELARPLPG